jgi:hypothetical protein
MKPLGNVTSSVRLQGHAARETLAGARACLRFDLCLSKTAEKSYPTVKEYYSHTRFDFSSHFLS